MDAVMTRLWEIGGGKHWYSATVDHNVALKRVGSTLFTSSGEYFEWVSSNLHWRGLRMVFDQAGSGVWYNDIADQLTDSPGLTDLADGECIYVDIDRTQNLTGGSALSGRKAVTATLGAPVIPGSRWVIAWRIGTRIYSRDAAWHVGGAGVESVATTSVQGTVKLYSTAATPSDPVVPVVNGSGYVVGTGLTRSSAGSLNVGYHDGSVSIGGNTADVVVGNCNGNMTLGVSVDGQVELRGGAASNVWLRPAFGYYVDSSKTVVGRANGASLPGNPFNPVLHGLIGISDTTPTSYGVWARGQAATGGGGGYFEVSGGNTASVAVKAVGNLGSGVQASSTNIALDGTNSLSGGAGLSVSAVTGSYGAKINRSGPQQLINDSTDKAVSTFTNADDFVAIEPGDNDDAYKNTITSTNIVKCYGRIAVAGTAGIFSVLAQDSFNVSSVTRVNQYTIKLTPAAAFTNTPWPTITATFMQGKIGDPSTLVKNKSDQSLIILSVVWYYDTSDYKPCFQLLDKNGVVDLDNIKSGEGVYFTFMAVGKQ
jgi:hypothetical protein